MLTKTIWNVLKKAEECNIRSIAIPAISSGIFKFPLPLCADIIVSTIKDFNDNKNPILPPFEIHLVNNDEPTVKEMERAFIEILSDPLPKDKSVHAAKTTSEHQVRLYKHNKNVV